MTETGTFRSIAGRTSLLLAKGRVLWPGVLLSFILATAAAFLADHYGAPVMLFALLLGLALNSLAGDTRCAPGIDFTAKRLLRIGIACLGARITAGQIAALGIFPLALVVICLGGTVIFGLLLARLSGRHWSIGMLTGGAVAICGASAALAISAVLPPHPERERVTLVTVVAVTVFSTVAMIAYPIAFTAFGFGETEIGLLLGVTIHDVAQVIGAGYGVSETVGDTASVVKLMRVALMPVVVVGLALACSRGAPGRAMPWPLFTLGFVAIMAANSAGLLPDALKTFLSDASRWLLVAAIGALGMKTSLGALSGLGPSTVVIILAETIFLAAVATGIVLFI